MNSYWDNSLLQIKLKLGWVERLFDRWVALDYYELHHSMPLKAGGKAKPTLFERSTHPTAQYPGVIETHTVQSPHGMKF